MTLAAWALVLVMGATAPPSITLVEDGSSRCSIVIPDESAPTVRHAARELSTHLKRISGADVPIVNESQPGGSLRDWEVIDACNEAGVTMVFTGQRSFRH